MPLQHGKQQIWPQSERRASSIANFLQFAQVLVDRATIGNSKLSNGFDSCQSAISESATVHYFSLVRALSSLHLEVLNSLPVGYVGECHCFSFVRALISLHIEVGLSYKFVVP
ncbi:unnamed protein product [Rodentolepis nana]|uniref:Uncharacterized protein n=1 Tax=Rodentolepis nana TaxID=102285 RepID=A0A0R3TV09_RODNA|nr:unnamed protein product [Rodentolepis nana]